MVESHKIQIFCTLTQRDGGPPVHSLRRVPHGAAQVLELRRPRPAGEGPERELLRIEDKCLLQ